MLLVTYLCLFYGHYRIPLYIYCLIIYNDGLYTIIIDIPSLMQLFVCLNRSVGVYKVPNHNKYYTISVTLEIFTWSAIVPLTFSFETFIHNTYKL